MIVGYSFTKPSPTTTDMALWLKPGGIAGKTEGDGLHGVTWSYSSGNGRDFVGGNFLTAVGPIYRTTTRTINGLPVVDMNQSVTQDAFSGPSGWDTLTQSWSGASIFLVGR